MKTLRIEVEGNTRGHYGSFMRKLGSDQIEVRILTPKLQNGLDRWIAAGSSQEALWAFAREIQLHLDDRHGTNSEINEVFLILQNFTD